MTECISVVDAEYLAVRQSDEHLRVVNAKPRLKRNRADPRRPINPHLRELQPRGQLAQVSSVDCVGHVNATNYEPSLVSRNICIIGDLWGDVDHRRTWARSGSLGEPTRHQFSDEALLHVPLHPICTTVDGHELVR